MKAIFLPLIAFSCFLQAGDMPCLEEYLTERQVMITEGYITSLQKQDIDAFLNLHPEIESIMEIGLNAGHSAENFFQTCKQLKKFISFDINWHDYTKVAVEYLSQKYPNAFQFIPGDSRTTVPVYATIYPQERFDLIYIDGDHSYSGASQDILNCKKLAGSTTILLIDDYTPEMEVKKAVDDLVEKQVIFIKNIYHSGDRCWIEACYN